MRQILHFLTGLALSAAALVAQDSRNIGTINVQADGTTIPVRIVGSTPELQSLALTAFNAHGRYRPVADRGSYTLNFTAVGASQVRVVITRGNAGTPVATETATGTSLRNALLRAADIAVTKTSGLRGFFAGKLACVSNRSGRSEIYTSDLFFGEVLMHPSNSKQIIAPHWAPDGTRIIFTAYRPLFPDIYVLDLRSHNLSLLVSFKGTNSGGRFSPDGSRTAMVLSGEGNPEVYVGNAQGRQIRRLTFSSGVEAGPCWSPDGSRLVLTSEPGPQLYLLPASGGSLSRLATNISNYCAEPDWCRWDASKIAFTCGVGRGFQIAVYDFSTRSSRIVSRAPYDAIEPCWMADGRHLVYTARTSSGRRLHLLDTESGKATPLSPSSFGSSGNASYLAP
ncbi:MAG: biopolymer transporter Tol [Opitutaceae bacterium]|nr:biopolymer transporter Tol [Opitutaceae bacterium]